MVVKSDDKLESGQVGNGTPCGLRNACEWKEEASERVLLGSGEDWGFQQQSAESQRAARAPCIQVPPPPPNQLIARLSLSGFLHSPVDAIILFINK